MYLTALRLQQTQQRGLIARTRIVGWKNVSRRAFIFWLLNRSLGLQIKILEKHLAVLVEVIQRDKNRRLFIVIVVALRPLRARQRRILFVPSALIHIAPERLH